MNFECAGTSDIGMSSLNDQMDGLNVVGWSNISVDYPQCYCGHYILVQCAHQKGGQVDVAMNSDPYFKWCKNPADEIWAAGDG